MRQPDHQGQPVPAKTGLTQRQGRPPGHANSASSALSTFFSVLSPILSLLSPQHSVLSPHLLIPRRKLLITLDFRLCKKNDEMFLTRRRGGSICRNSKKL